MEENYSNFMKTTPLFSEDVFLINQVVGDDYELLLIDMLLAYSYRPADQCN